MCENIYLLKVSLKAVTNQKKVALITGITGQDGAYLSEYLLSRNYEVHGIVRRSSSHNTHRIDNLCQKHNLFLHFGDLTDSLNLVNLIKKINPDEIYNLGAMSHVQISFEVSEYASNVDGLGTLRLLEAIKILNLTNKIKFYQASTSELFSGTNETLQNEDTAFHPKSPYGVAKLYSYWITVNYREAYKIFACNGILFNHESPKRSENFVTRKITLAVARIVYNLQQKLYLGNLNAIRDWGHAKDYVRAMHLILQHDKPDDFIIATGYAYSVREFAYKAFANVGIYITFYNKDENEIGVIESINSELLFAKSKSKALHLKKGQTLIEVKKEFFRPLEPQKLIGDATKAKKLLNWYPTYSLDDIIYEMVDADLNLLYSQISATNLNYVKTLDQVIV